MRQAATRIAGCLALLLVFFGASGWAEAAVSDCDPNTKEHRVIGVLQADAVAAQGYDNMACNLIILTSLPGTAQAPMALNLVLNAQTVEVGGVASHVNIINHAAGSSISIKTTGDISVLNASLKAHKNLRIECTGMAPDCTFTSDNGSELIVATDPLFDAVPLGPGGVMLILTQGPISIKNTAVHAGDTFHFTSKKASVTLGPCPGGSVGACQDPNGEPGKPPTPIVVQECGLNPDGTVKLPCTLNVANAAELRSICFPDTPGQPCNGGFKEKGISAATFIDIRNTEITSQKHVVLTCGTELLASGAKITVEADKIVMQCGRIDLTDATLSAFLNVEVTASCVGVAAVDPCIDATDSALEGREVKLSADRGAGIIDAVDASFNNTSAKFPTLNGVSVPPYPATVLTTGLTVCKSFLTAPDCQSF